MHNVGKSEFKAQVERIPKERLKEYKNKIAELRKEIGKVVVGQQTMVDGALTSLICSAHALLEGVPGLAKSLTVETLARIIEGTTFKRIQFMPDMLPADIVGVNVYNPKTGDFYIVKGPIFANFILADEINRAPPKTQAAMLEAMQEKKVNIHTYEFQLPKPFFVMATQNPLEQQGVYPLPEALVDRFFLKILVDYPTYEEEKEIIDRNTVVRDPFKELRPVVTKDFILQIQRDVRRVYISEPVKEYILNIVFTTRGMTDIKIPELKYVRYGGSPRASIYLGLGARAVAIMNGRDYVIPDDVKQIAHPVLRHRIILNYEGRALGISTDQIITDILNEVEAP